MMSPSFTILRKLCLGLFFLAVGSSMSPELQLQMYQAQCNQADDVMACSKAGVLLEKQGKRKEAILYYQKACNAKEAIGTACFLLGMLVPSEKEKTTFFHKGCQLGDADSCTEKGLRLLKNKQIQAGYALLKKACQRGDGRGCYYVSFSYKTGDPKKQKALHFSCHFQYPRGCRLLGNYWHQHKKEEKAFLAWSKACKSQDGFSCFQLSQMTHPTNPVLSQKWKEKACSLGYPKTCLPKKH